MPVDIRWLDESTKTILLNTWDAAVTLEDFARSVQENKRWLTSVNHQVDLIVDARAVQRTYFGNALAMRSRMEVLMPPNQRFVVVVGLNALLKATIGVGQRLGSKALEQIYFAESIDEAVARLREMQHEINA